MENSYIFNFFCMATLATEAAVEACYLAVISVYFNLTVLCLDWFVHTFIFCWNQLFNNISYHQPYILHTLYTIIYYVF